MREVNYSCRFGCKGCIHWGDSLWITNCTSVKPIWIPSIVIHALIDRDASAAHYLGLYVQLQLTDICLQTMPQRPNSHSIYITSWPHWGMTFTEGWLFNQRFRHVSIHLCVEQMERVTVHCQTNDHTNTPVSSEGTDTCQSLSEILFYSNAGPHQQITGMHFLVLHYRYSIHQWFYPYKI
jgi:hypothetical protein